MSTLEQRILAALADDAISSKKLAQLITETAAAADEAGKRAQLKREQSEDLILAPDGEEAQQEALATALACKRLYNALDRLKTQLEQVEAREHVERWTPEFERVEAQSAKLKTEFTKVYNEYATKLVDLFQHVAECDRAIASINGSAPRGEHRRVAHPVDAIHIAAVRLPALDNATMLWPVPVKTLSQQYIETMGMVAPPHPGADWWRAQAAERPRVIADVNRAAAIENENARQREERENAERYAANEARRAARG